MDIPKQRYEQMYQLSSKLQTALSEIQQLLQKIIKLSNNMDNRSNQTILNKNSTRKQHQAQQTQQNMEFQQNGSTESQQDNDNQKQDQSFTNEPHIGRKQIVLSSNTSNNKIIPEKNGKPLPKLDIPKPKAPLSPFFLFMKQQRDIVKQQYPNLPPNHIAKMFGKIWKNLTLQQKQPYYDIYARSQSNYLSFIAKIGHKMDAK